MADLDPLQSLLRHLAEGRIYDKQALAHTFGMDETVLEQMLSQLETWGYLRTVVGECHRACAHCAYEGLCALTQGERIWVLTERGRRAVKGLAEPRGE